MRPSPPRAARVLLFLGAAALLLGALAPVPAHGQWTHRYPRVDGYGHHVYLEGYELPTVAAGPMDAAPSPDGRTVVVAARGWLWALDPVTGTAEQLTSGGAMDSRPAWAPDGSAVAFVRDDGADTDIWMLELSTGSEWPVVETPALDLDPAFDADGSLYYSSAVEGTLDLWRMDPDTGERVRVTQASGIELRPQPHPDGRRLLYVAKRGGPDRVVVRDLETGAEDVLHQGAILSQLRPALSPDGSLVAFQTPRGQGDAWELRLAAVDDRRNTVLLVGSDDDRLPLAPGWSADGETIWFTEADRRERLGLWRVPTDGGKVEAVPVEAWAWETPPSRLRIRTRSADADALPARISVVDGNGHPLLPDDRQAWFDGQSGTVFFYSSGVVEVEAPPGPVTVTAARGIAAPAVSATTRLEAGAPGEVVLGLEPVWDPAAEGWMGGDHHFHLNYGGPYRLEPEDIRAMAEGEALDVATPVIANLQNRFGEQDFWGWSNGGRPPLVRFAQEVRASLGHMGLIGIQDLYWPWIWGPGHQVYGEDDRTNAQVTAHARSQGGLSTYVHPVMDPDPFAQEGAPGLPTEMAADGVLGDLDAIEVACLWSDERGSAEAWYRFLNLGRPVVPTAGTDVMTDFFRTMAIGTTRVYVHTGEARTFDAYVRGLKAGRSFVTNGPLLDLRVEDVRPGGAVDPASSGAWTLDVHSAVPVETVELLVNGEVVWSGTAPDAPGSRSYQGTLDLPPGGWIAARVTGPETTGWPAMDSYAFGHTAPVWIGAVGSTEPGARRAAAAELLLAVEQALEGLRARYGAVDIPRLEGHFEAARAELQAILGG